MADFASMVNWLGEYARNPSPHPITQAMPNFAEMAQTIGRSGANLLNRTGEALYQARPVDPNDYGRLTEDLLNTSMMGAPTALAANRPIGPFYSALRQAAEGMPFNKAPASQWEGTLRNAPGIKQEELEWTGFTDWLKGQKGPVTKEQATKFLDENAVDVQEVVKGQGKPDPVHDAFMRRTEERIASGDYVPPHERAQFERDYDAWSNVAGFNGTKFSQYQLPGGENYRELLLTLPSKRGPDIEGNLAGRTAQERAYLERKMGTEAGDFTGGHYDEPNVLAHVRFNDRTDAAGKKTLFLEEIQSDWHQRGRKEGYRGLNAPADPREIDKLLSKAKLEKEALEGARSSQAIQGESPYGQGIPAQAAPYGNAATNAERIAQLNQEINRLERLASGVNPPPDAPFKSTWPDLSLKRMIKYAVDNGYDQIAWTPGKVQAERYDLSKQIRALRVVRNTDGTFDLGANPLNERAAREGAYQQLASSVPPDKLSDYVGKDLAEKIANDNIGMGGQQTYSGLDLRVGGEGMNAFYDKMLPSVANALAKKNKWGTKVGVTKIQARGLDTYASKKPDVGQYQQEVWSLPITDAMRKEVGAKGMPLFSGGPNLGAAALGMNYGQELSTEDAKKYRSGGLL